MPQFLSDWLFAFAEWLRTTSLVEFSLWLSQTSLSEFIQSHFFFIPILQTLHILAVAMGFGSVLLIDSRIFGVTGQGQSLSWTVRRYIPWIWAAFITLIISGIGLIIGEPVRELVNPIFWVKITFAIVIFATTLAFYHSAKGRFAQWDASGATDGGLRGMAVLFLVLWVIVIFGGRWIAYAPV